MIKLARYSVYIIEDDYENGEGETVSSWEDTTLDEGDTFDDIKSALDMIIESNSFAPTGEWIADEDSNGNIKFSYMTTTDIGGCMPDKEDVEDWKKGEAKLYTLLVSAWLYNAEKITWEDVDKAGIKSE